VSGLPVRLSNEEKGIYFEAPSIGQAVITLESYGIKTSHSTVRLNLTQKSDQLFKGWKAEFLPRLLVLQEEEEVLNGEDPKSAAANWLRDFHKRSAETQARIKAARYAPKAAKNTTNAAQSLLTKAAQSLLTKAELSAAKGGLLVRFSNEDKGIYLSAPLFFYFCLLQIIYKAL